MFFGGCLGLEIVLVWVENNPVERTEKNDATMWNTERAELWVGRYDPSSR